MAAMAKATTAMVVMVMNNEIDKYRNAGNFHNSNCFILLSTSIKLLMVEMFTYLCAKSSLCCAVDRVDNTKTLDTRTHTIAHTQSHAFLSIWIRSNNVKLALILDHF